jgi:hypothetical protein
MAISPLLPLYPDAANFAFGPFHVSFTIESPIPSIISKSIGMTSSSSLLVPNIEYLEKFINGDIGLADSVLKEALNKNFASNIVSTNEALFKKFAEINKIPIDDINKYKKDGKYVMPKGEVKIPSEAKASGLHAFEKTLLRSIFETQKPYIEIIKLVVENIGKLEDIVARIMPLASAQPLVALSEKPIGNVGNNTRPKALGLEGGAAFKKNLGRLKKASRKGTTIKVKPDGSVLRFQTVNPPSGSNNSTGGLGLTSSSLNNSTTEFPGWTYSVISTVYSTGDFSPFVDYKYTYIDLPPDEPLGDAPPENVKLDDNGDPYAKYKPEKIILGIFNSEGAPVNPNELLKTVSLDVNGQVSSVATPYKRAEWILRSQKWALPDRLSDKRGSRYVWPTLATPIYRWKRFESETDSPTRPAAGQNMPDWDLKRYKKDEKNILTGDPAVENAPIIVGFQGDDLQTYVTYMTNLIDYSFFKIDLPSNEKVESSNELKSAIEIHQGMNQTFVKRHLENVSQYGQAKSSVYTTTDERGLSTGDSAFPDTMRNPFKPFQYYSPQAANDGVLRAFAQSKGVDPAFIWIDPETDYDYKVIRIDPTTNIEYEEGQAAPEIQVDIKSFVKNKLTIDVQSLNAQTREIVSRIPFSIEVVKNGIPEVYENLSDTYVLENWNYISDVSVPPEQRVKNDNTFNLTIWSKTPTRTYSEKTGRIVIKRELLAPNISDLLSNNNNLMWVYELVWENDKIYYKRYKWTISTVKIIVLILIGSASPLLLLTLIALYEADPETKWTISFSVRNILSRIEDAISYIDNELDALNVPRSVSFELLEVKYTFELRLDKLIEKVKDFFGVDDDGNVKTELGQKILDEILGFEFSYTFWLKDLFPKKIYAPLPAGVTKMKDNFETRIELAENMEVLRWYYLYKRDVLPLTNNNDVPLVLPPFGKEFTVVVDHNSDPNDISQDLRLIRTENDIPLYNLKVANNEFPYGKVIDPGKVTNDLLANKTDLFSLGKYGHGSDTNPQKIDVIKRFMLTDLDTESYYIIEGVLIDKNPRPNIIPPASNGGQSGGGQAGQNQSSSYYRLPDALGAIRPFVSILVSIFSKLLPQIKSLLKLLKDPRSFIVDIISEKLGESYDIISKEAISSFTDVLSISKSSFNRKSDFVNRVDRHFKASKLRPVVFTNREGDFRNIIDGVALIPFSIFDKQIDFGMELKFDNLKESKPPIGLVLPKNIKFSKVKNLATFVNPLSYNENKVNGAVSLLDLQRSQNSGINLDDEKNKIPNDVKKRLENYEIVNIKYSTGNFIEGINYNYIYIDQDVQNLILEADELAADETTEGLDKAKQKLEDALNMDPLNELIKLKLKDIRRKKNFLESQTQPTLKIILGILVTPIKIIAGIIEWLMNFFKGLINPITLPQKLTELLSFGWFKQFFTPTGLLEIAGIKFKKEKLQEWLEAVNVLKDGGQPPAGDIPQDIIYSNAYPQGKYKIPDDEEFADLNKFISIGFLAKLPIYTAKQLREHPKNPLALMRPLLCLLEKLINAIIDLFWSLIGLEAIIPPPHLKLCKKIDGETLKPEDLQKILSGEEPSGSAQSNPSSGVGGGGSSGTGQGSNGQSGQTPATEEYVYEVQLSDGTIVKGLNQEQLQAYIDDNKDVSYDFLF